MTPRQALAHAELAEVARREEIAAMASAIGLALGGKPGAIEELLS